MQYGHLPGIDKSISRLVQGTVSLNSKDMDASFKLLDEVYALGCTAFDTAHVYGTGDSERTLGKWVQKRGSREKVVIITKGAHPNADRRRVTPYDITADLHDSLARLNTDYIDLYLLHRDDPSVPVGPLMDILNEHHAAGKIRAFGGSNWTYTRIREANEYAAAHGLTPFIVSSPQYSLAEMMKEPWPGCISIGGASGEAARDWYQNNQMALFTWSSLAGGFLSGRFRRDNLDTFTDYYDKVCVHGYCYEENFQRLDRAEQLAAEKGLSLPQIALAYTLSQPLNIFALIGCKSGAEYQTNITAMELKLTPEARAWLDLKVTELS
jgi:aryl-alcohol dehydrogenase-like predicted oxidoreductase